MSFLNRVKQKHKVSAWMGGSMMLHPLIAETLKKVDEILQKEGRKLSPEQSKKLTEMLLDIAGKAPKA